LKERKAVVAGDVMRIRSETMKSFDQYIKDSFSVRMEAHLRQLYPEQIDRLSQKQLQSLIKDGLNGAEWYGIQSEEDTARFLELCVVLGNGFDAQPENAWARSILEEEGQPATDRLDAIFERIHFGDI
jgi:hypothetical protein